MIPRIVPRIVVVGEALFDIFPDGVSKLGGAPLNVAAFIRQMTLDHAWGVSFVSRLGRDRLGDEALRGMRSVGLLDRFIQFDSEKPTGTVDVFPRSHDGAAGEGCHIHPQVAYDSLELTPDLVREVRAADVIIFGSLIQRTAAGAATLRQLIPMRNPSALTVADLNLRIGCYSRDSLLFCLNEASIVKLNHEDLHTLADLGLTSSRVIGDLVTELLHRFPQMRGVVVTEGHDGLTVADRITCRKVPGTPLRAEEVRDTVGCGDAVTAALVVRMKEGASLLEAAEFANRAGAFAATKPGGVYRFSRSELEAFVGNPRHRTPPPGSSILKRNVGLVP